MSYDVQFVDSIAESPTVRLDLMAPGWTVRDGTTFGMPELRRSAVGTLLRDGEQYPAGAYGNRTLTLVLRFGGTSDDDRATMLQQLARELDRPTNILRYRPGTSAPVFFRTHRAGPESVTWDPFTKEARVSIPAQPFAYGLRETLPAVTVYNDPAEGATANANPYFETDATGWSAVGGTVARSTAQAHEGSASLLLTPDGVTASVEARSELLPVVAGESVRASAWVRCTAARSVSVGLIVRNASGSVVSTPVASVSVAAGTWTLIDGTHAMPVGAAQAQIVVGMGSTPPGSHLLHIDEARMRRPGGVGGASLEVTGVKGDFETPLYLRLGSDFMNGSPGDSHTLVIGVRRRGTPALAPFLLQAESMAPGTNTTLAAAFDSAMSGAGPNYMRIAPAGALMEQRLYADPFPAAAGVDVRGRYRVLARVRQSDVLDQWVLQFAYGPNITLPVRNDAVTVSQTINPRYVDLGTVQWPFGVDPVTDGVSGVEVPTRGTRISLWAQRASGTGTLDVDCLLFVPADDAYSVARIFRDSAATAGIIDGDRTMVYAVSGSGAILPPFAPHEVTSGFPLVSPGATNRIVFLADGGAVADSPLGSTWTVTPYYWPRYGYVRPPAS